MTADAWDIIVVGAGPAGAVAAAQASTGGGRVLLLDKTTFPRPKVCGGCLNASAMTMLHRLGMSDAVAEHAPSFDALHLAVRGRSAILRLPSGRAVCRAGFDAALVEQAVRRGVTFRDGVRVKLGDAAADARRIIVNGEALTARLVIAADGLHGRLLDNVPAMATTVRQASRLGLSAVTTSVSLPAGAIHMAVGAGGYVGMVALGDGRVNLAAAVDASWLRHTGGAGEAVRQILAEAGQSDAPDPTTLDWRGTPPLTRRRRVACERVLVAGDAAGYVEPFTGEGMAWAIQVGAAAGALAANAVRCDTPPARIIRQWTRQHARMMRMRRLTCRLITDALRHPWLIAATLGPLRWSPPIAWPLVRLVHRCPHVATLACV